MTQKNWQKKGLIYAPKGENGWDKHTVLTPNPIVLNDKIIRIYCGFRDEVGCSRIGYIDVDGHNPSSVIKVSKTPVLDIGSAGCFDDSGMLLGDVIPVGDKLYMYYVGFQLPKKVKFMAFSGLAISGDGGESFARYSSVPIMDRSENSHFIRAIHSVMFENGIFKIWYSVGSSWHYFGDTPFPVYHIRYTESKDGINFDDNLGKECILPNENEYRIGRPRVTKENGKYIMRYTFDTLNKEYKTGYAQSDDGINWIRQDYKVGITTSEAGWDSQTVCYPVELKFKDKTYLFYSGNNMGETGVGYAELV